MTNALTIPSRFNGPPGIGNGGYVCGRIAGYVDGPATVTLRRPPPLDTPLAVENHEGSIRILSGRTLIGEAAPAPDAPALEIPDPVSPAEARAAAGRARYFADPVFPDCFVCGMNRLPGDGLRIFPGPVAGRAVWAAPWAPDPSVADAGGRVRPEVVWAALDCPSGIAAAEAAGLGAAGAGPGWDAVILLGRMTASLTRRPAVGDQCRVIAWPQTRDGRKLTAGSALVGPGDEVLAVGAALWLTVPHPGQTPAAEAAGRATAS